MSFSSSNSGELSSQWHDIHNQFWQSEIQARRTLKENALVFCEDGNEQNREIHNIHLATKHFSEACRENFNASGCEFFINLGISGVTHQKELMDKQTAKLQQIAATRWDSLINDMEKDPLFAEGGASGDGSVGMTWDPDIVELREMPQGNAGFGSGEGSL